MRRREVLCALAALAMMQRSAAAASRDPAWPPALAMGTASPGGTYAAYGPAWGMLAQEASGVAISYRATEGPTENLILLDRNAVALGMTTIGVAQQAWSGTGGWTAGVRFRSFRALFPMYEAVLHGVARASSGIRSLRQLAGRRVGVGPAGGTAGSSAPRLLAALGLRDVSIVYGTIADQADAMLDGSLDACLVAAGAPVPAFAAAETQAPVVYLGVTGEEAAAIGAALPEFGQTTIPRGAYRGLTDDLATLGVFSLAVCRHDLDEALIFALTAGVMDHLPRLRAEMPLASQTAPANLARDSVVPLHAGAARYYRARGFAVPTELLAG